MRKLLAIVLALWASWAVAQTINGGGGSGGGGGGTVTSVAGGCGTTASPSPITATGTIGSTVTDRTVTSGTDTILAADCGNVVYYNSASAIAITQPAPSGSFANGFFTTLCNINTGVPTITPGSGTIAGASTFAIPTGTAAAPSCISYNSDGTNFNVVANAPVPASIIPNVKGTSRSVSGTSDTLGATDCGKTIIYTSNSAVAVTIPSAMVPASGVTCNIAVLQDGTSKITLSGSGVTVISGHSYTGTSGTSGSIIGLMLTTISASAIAILTGDGS